MAAMRLNVWLTRPWRCKVGRHEIADDRNWGFGFGMVDYFCIRCEQRVKSVPVGEVSEYMRIKIDAASRRVNPKAP